MIMQGVKIVVAKGKVTEFQKELFVRQMAKLPNGEFYLFIKKRKKLRTTPQNALYWLWCSVIAESTGHSREEIHDTFKAMFLVDRSGKLPFVHSTTELDTNQFGEYLDKIQAKAMELDIKLPDPSMLEMVDYET